MEQTRDGCECRGAGEGNNRRRVEIGAATRILKARIPIARGAAAASDEEGSSSTNSTVELIGRSWAADSTAFVIPQLNIGLDAGYIVNGRRMSDYFVTHVHSDHAHFLTHLKSRSKPPKIYLPAESVEVATRFLDAAQQMTSHMTPEEYDNFSWTKCYEFVGVRAGDHVVVDKKRSLVCDVVHCDHGIPCVGYCFSRVKNKLNPEFREMESHEIGKLRKQGVEVTIQETTPLFAFLGDTSVAGLLGDESDEGVQRRDRVLACPTVIVECSFLTDDCREQADLAKHVLWSDLKPYVESHPETTFVLIHFSHRWKVHDIVDFFAAEENYLPNVFPWVPKTGLYCCPVGQETPTADKCEEVWGHF